MCRLSCDPTDATIHCYSHRICKIPDPRPRATVVRSRQTPPATQHVGFLLVSLFSWFDAFGIVFVGFFGFCGFPCKSVVFHVFICFLLFYCSSVSIPLLSVSFGVFVLFVFGLFFGLFLVSFRSVFAGFLRFPLASLCFDQQKQNCPSRKNCYMYPFLRPNIGKPKKARPNVCGVSILGIVPFPWLFSRETTVTRCLLRFYGRLPHSNVRPFGGFKVISDSVASLLRD